MRRRNKWLVATQITECPSCADGEHKLSTVVINPENIVLVTRDDKNRTLIVTFAGPIVVKESRDEILKQL